MLPALITHKSTTIRKNTGIASFSCSRGTAWNGLRKLLDLNIRLGCEKCSSVRVFGRRNHTRRVTAFQDITSIHYGEVVLIGSRMFYFISVNNLLHIDYMITII